MKPNPKKKLQEAGRLHRADQTVSAIAAYHRYLALVPMDSRAWADLGGILLVRGRLEEAREALANAIRLDPAEPAHRVNLANALTGLGLTEESEALCWEVLADHPKYSEGRLALARCLIQKNDAAQACSVLEGLISEEPGHQNAHHLLVEVLIHLGRWEAVGETWGRLIGLLDYPTVIQNYDRGLLDLRLGRMPRGWDGYEWRWQCPGLIGPKRSFSQPRWDGTSFKGKTLLVYFEQGLGDTFMFVRFAPLVKALGGKVLLEVQPALADVVATCAGVDEVIAHGSPIPPFDLQIPLLSLPGIFRTDLESIPAAVPYLDVPERVPNRQKILGLLSTPKDHVRIGLVWAGSPTHTRDKDRSLPPDFLAPLAALPEVTWFSFQLGVTKGLPIQGMVSLDASIRNFSDTAYALSGMQLVITVDTALAHLAGAMGIPTFLLVSFIPDWRWMMGRNDSPWYPSMQIYRQPSPGDWASVIQQVLEDLTQE